MEEEYRVKLSSALQSVLEQVRSAIAAPAISAGISSSGSRVIAYSGSADLARSWPASENSRYGIACLTKLLVAIVATKLSSDGRLCLDISIDDLVMECGVKHFNRGITLRHLLSHSGGFQGPLIYGVSYRQFNWPTFSAELSSLNQTFVPGSVFNYENAGHVIVGEIIRHVTGREIGDLIDEFIFSPLNIVPRGAFDDYKDRNAYVAPHRIDNGIARTVAPSLFGSFWSASLADITLTLGDMLAIGEAILGQRKEVDFSSVRTTMVQREVSLPHCVSGVNREHSPAFFSAICAEYGSGWFGYAGSALGQTCGLRFDLRTGTVCAVALNAWLPIARDALLDRFCNASSHADAGLPGGNVGFTACDLAGEYVGGGNIVRSIRVTAINDREILCSFGSDGLPGPELRFALDDNLNLVPDRTMLMPSVGFFSEPKSNVPCIMVGLAALKRAGEPSLDQKS